MAGDLPAIRRRRRAVVAAVLLLVGIVASVVVSAVVGQFHASIGEVVDSLRRVVVDGVDYRLDRTDALLWTVRFPRAVLAVVVGAALAVAGAAMQGVFANPLADPSIIGINAGAAVGAGAVLVAGVSTAASLWLLPGAALIGATAVALAVWWLARAADTAAVVMLILVGVAINAVAVAATSVLIFIGAGAARDQVIFWQLGTLARASWPTVALTAAVTAAALAILLTVHRRLDVLALGDVSAQASGVAVRRLRALVVLVVALLTAVAVAAAGVVAFVGLIVPQAIRLTVGPAHRYLLPLSALGGALLISTLDIAARTVVPFADLPLGVFTAAIGAPVFLLLLRRTLRGLRGTA